MAAFMTLLILLYAPADATQARRIGWWWDAPDTATDPSVQVLLGFCKNNTDIVSSVLMRCGVTTANGAPTGVLSPACAVVIPALNKMGISSELWLGETDSAEAAKALISNNMTTVAVLRSLGEKYPGISGFNFDLEVSGSSTWCGGSSAACSRQYAKFLLAVKQGLGGKWRVTADASCAVDGRGWAPIISDCSVLAQGADRFMNMATYNAPSMEVWLEQLAPALAQDVPRDSLGAGLGCWIEASVPAWSLTNESASQRICHLMNQSVIEIDMFRLNPPQWPQNFWLPQLRKFMTGDGCVPPPPSPPPPSPPNDCPAAGWQPCSDAECVGCCVIMYNDVHCTNREACAKQQCEASKTKVNTWKPEDYNHHPYTCCPAPAV